MSRVEHELTVAVHSLGGVSVAALRGELDLDTSDRLEDQLQPIRQGSGPAVIDLRGVRFMDSSGLHVIVTLWRALREDGRSLAVCCGAGGVRKLLELTALDELLPIHEDAAAATTSLGGRGTSGVSAREP